MATRKARVSFRRFWNKQRRRWVPGIPRMPRWSDAHLHAGREYREKPHPSDRYVLFMRGRS